MNPGILWLLAVLACLMGGLALWLRRGHIPRRRRLHGRIQRLLHQKNWSAAQGEIAALRRLGPLSPWWEEQVRQAEGECWRLAGEAALDNKQFEASLKHLQDAAALLGRSPHDARDHVLGAMLAEVRRLFATTSNSQTEPVRALIDRLFQIHRPCAEASFWLGMCCIREDRIEDALAALRISRETADKPCLDPLLYQGMLLLRDGRIPEALRCLAEAHRLESGCPFVAWQLGLALVAGNGDASLAVRALQHALGANGLPSWIKTPNRAWVEGFPDTSRSYVPRLARDHVFVCPLLGGDVARMVRQAQFTLSQAYYRLGNYQQAAQLTEMLLREAPPTLPVLRSLGLALARLERYDEAYKHLRAAFEMEGPKNPLTAGYLALCGARGKPNRPEDKPRNVAWAIRLLSQFHEQLAHGEASRDGHEWAGLCNAILAEARRANLPVAVEDLLPCCDALARVTAVNAEAAAAYHQLAVTSPDALRPQHAWLYCQAAQQHGHRGPCELDLFALAFRDRAAAEAFFAQHNWDLAEVEYLYLQRWAEQHPASLPEVLGPDYAPRAEELLRKRLEQKEQAGQYDAAVQTAALMHRLLPCHSLGYEQLARLHYRHGDRGQVLPLLQAWQRLDPTDYRPRLRLAVLLHHQRDATGWTAALDGALALTTGQLRAQIAFLGAQLALREALVLSNPGSPGAGWGEASLARRYLDLCLREQPHHADALACLAALRWLSGDQEGLVLQAEVMNQSAVPDPRYHYLTAVCHMARADYHGMLAAAERALTEERLAIEARYLMGLAQMHLGEVRAAEQSLQEVALVPHSVSGGHARGLLGLWAFHEGRYNDAVYWWQMLDPAQRAAWRLEETYRGSVCLAAVQAYHLGRFEQAIEQLRLAKQLGWSDPHWESLLGLALFKEGQRRFYAIGPRPWLDEDSDSSAEIDPESDCLSSGEIPAEQWQPAVLLLEQATQTGLADAQVNYLLALAYQRQGRLEEARACLNRIQPADALVWLQLGILSLKKGQLRQAEQELSQAWQLDPRCYAAGMNLLLTRLSLGKLADAQPLAAPVVSLAPDPEEWYRATLLHALLRNQEDNGSPDSVLVHMTFEDEQGLIRLLRSLGNLETARHLLQILLRARPDSIALREAHIATIFLEAKRLLDQCEWSAAERHLLPWAHQASVGPATQLLLYNLLGCTACLCQDFRGSIPYFQAALRFSGADAALHQNLALAYEWLCELDKAELHWNRYFDLLERHAALVDQRDHFLRVVCEGHVRLANLYASHERWPLAVYHLEAAQRLRPTHVASLERLFQLYRQMRRPDQARRVLFRLQELCPNEPQYDLYELDLIAIDDVEDLERWFHNLAHIQQRYPGDARVKERSRALIDNAITFLLRSYEQRNEHLRQLMKQIRYLDHEQINWSAVHDLLNQLMRELQRLRKLVGRCYDLTIHEGQQQQLRELADQLDGKMDYCRKWQAH